MSTPASSQVPQQTVMSQSTVPATLSQPVARTSRPRPTSTILPLSSVHCEFLLQNVPDLVPFPTLVTSTRPTTTTLPTPSLFDDVRSLIDETHFQPVSLRTGAKLAVGTPVEPSLLEPLLESEPALLLGPGIPPLCPGYTPPPPTPIPARHFRFQFPIPPPAIQPLPTAAESPAVSVSVVIPNLPSTELPFSPRSRLKAASKKTVTPKKKKPAAEPAVIEAQKAGGIAYFQALTDAIFEEEDSLLDSPTPKTIHAMALEAKRLFEARQFTEVPAEPLKRLLMLLGKCIAGWGFEQADARASWNDLKDEKLVLSVEAAMTILYVLSTPDLPTSFYDDEVIETVLNLTGHLLKKHIFPAYDESYRTSATTEAEAPDGAPADDDKKPAKAAKGRKKQPPPLCDQFMNRVCALLDRLHEFVTAKSLNEMTAIKLFAGFPEMRTVILKEIFSSITKGELSAKKLKRTYKGTNWSPDWIPPHTRTVNSHSKYVSLCLPAHQEDDMTLNAETARNANTFDGSLRCAQAFVDWFMRRCFPTGTAKDKGDTTAKDYREAFIALVEDLVTILFRPEWPVAEVLLSLMCSTLMRTVTSPQKAGDLAVRTLALDVLGRVCTEMHHAQLDAGALVDPQGLDGLVSKEQQALAAAAASTTSASSQSQPAGPGRPHCAACKKEIIGAAASLRCSNCGDSFHLRCVSGAPAPSDERPWQCDRCIVAAQVQEQPSPKKKKGGRRAKAQPLDAPPPPPADAPDRQPAATLAEAKECVLKELLFNYLAAQTAPEAIDASHYLVCLWDHMDHQRDHETAATNPKKPFYQRLWSFESTPVTRAALPRLSTAGSLQIARWLGQSHPFMLSLSSLIKHVVAMLEDGQIQIRVAFFCLTHTPHIHAPQDGQIQIRDGQIQIRVAFFCLTHTPHIHAPQDGQIQIRDGQIQIRVAFFCLTHTPHIHAAQDGQIQIRDGQIQIRVAFFCLTHTPHIHAPQDGQIQIRIHALKALTAIVRSKPSVLGEDVVREGVRQRFVDISIRVRESAVDLVGQYIFHQAQLSRQYYQMVVDRNQDKGTSVRKKVVKILKAICLQQPNHPHIADICGVLIRRIHDAEESVKREVVGAFEDLWFKGTFDPLTAKTPVGVIGAGAALEDAETQSDPSASTSTTTSATAAPPATATPVPLDALDEHAALVSTLTLQQRLQQMVFTLDQSTSHEWLVELLKRLLAESNRSLLPFRSVPLLHTQLTQTRHCLPLPCRLPHQLLAETNKSRAQVRSICSHMCECLVNSLLALEETPGGQELPHKWCQFAQGVTTYYPEHFPHVSLPSEYNASQPCPQLSHTRLSSHTHTSRMQFLHALAAFGDADSKLLSPHIVTLSRYLLIEPGRPLRPDESRVVEYVLTILVSVLPMLSSLAVEFVANLEKALILLVLNAASLQIVEMALKCVSRMVVQVSKNKTLLVDTLVHVYRPLQRCRAFQATTAEAEVSRIRGAAERSLSLVALAMRHFDFDANITADHPAAAAVGLHAGHYLETVINELTYYCDFADVRIKCRAIHSLGMVMCRAKESAGPPAGDSQPEEVSVFRSLLDVYCRRTKDWLAPTSGREIQLATLRSLHSFLTDEEEKILSKQSTDLTKAAKAAAKPSKSAASKKAASSSDDDTTTADEASDAAGGAEEASGVVDDDDGDEADHEHEEAAAEAEGGSEWLGYAHDSGVSSTLFQHHQEALLRLVLDASLPHRRAALQVVKVGFIQGVLHPEHCISALVTLFADEEPATREMAQHLFTETLTKKPDWVTCSSIVSGILGAFDFLRRIRPAASGGSLAYYTARGNTLPNTPIFGRLFTSLRERGRAKRKEFLREVTNKLQFSFDFPGRLDTELMLFLVEILASLSYTVQDDPLGLVYFANQTIIRLLSELQPRLKEPLKARKEQPETDPVSPDVLATARQVEVLLALYRLKAFLKSAYGLSDSKCQAYSPWDAKATEKPAVRSEDAAEFALPAPVNERSNLGAIRALYATLKNFAKGGDDISVVAKPQRGRGGRKKATAAAGEEAATAVATEGAKPATAAAAKKPVSRGKKRTAPKRTTAGRKRSRFASPSSDDSSDEPSLDDDDDDDEDAGEAPEPPQEDEEEEPRFEEPKELMVKQSSRLLCSEMTSPTPTPTPNPVVKCQLIQFHLDGKDFSQYRSSTGGLKLLEERVVTAQRSAMWKIFKDVGRSVLDRGKNLVNFSLPTSVFECRSLLHKLCDAWAYAPIYLTRAAATKDPTERMKCVIAFIFSGLHLAHSFWKPFNPILGETYQGSYPDGTQLFLEQSTHHPPGSRWLVIGPHNAWRFHGSAIMSAAFRGNVVWGSQTGPNVIEFADGQKIEFSTPTMGIHGLLMGERFYDFAGTLHFRDTANRIGAEISINCDAPGFLRGLFARGKSLADTCRGTIFRYPATLAPRLNGLVIPSDTEKAQCEKLADIEGGWFSYLEIAHERLWEINRERPFHCEDVERALPSDARFREDLRVHALGNNEASNVIKIRMEEQQRHEARLRKQYHDSHPDLFAHQPDLPGTAVQLPPDDAAIPDEASIPHSADEDLPDASALAAMAETAAAEASGTAPVTFSPSPTPTPAATATHK
ncbi:putative Oxysterol-binding protein 9 [Paratrimastix pyriformis]|uniref:Sister chromatid cohesion protein n=1 Tax=Paratrimastix pyriformis TaxID=342808 RepID=A0ABQ8U2Y3_9EUKA|nr:putative Oxysterol-binding protein 9 [Paratrimastix pyriformis]